MLHTSHCNVYTVHTHSSYTYSHLHTICGAMLVGACRNCLWLKVPQSRYDTLIPWYAPTLLQAMQINTYTHMHIRMYMHLPHVCTDQWEPQLVMEDGRQGGGTDVGLILSCHKRRVVHRRSSAGVIHVQGGIRPWKPLPVGGTGIYST